MRRVLHTLAAVPWAKAILVCYLIWWLVVISTNFPLVSSVWVDAAIIGVVVGFALNLNAYEGGHGMGALLRHLYANKWMIFRFFLIPFLVASYSGAIAVERDRFQFLWPKDPFVSLAGVSLSAALLGSLAALKQLDLYLNQPPMIGEPRVWTRPLIQDDEHTELSSFSSIDHLASGDGSSDGGEL
eukprot:TRINITY_DN12551_c0_g1_i1.p1 TRINITY_DN12551_c0_g1~~TRINITY_DN12551_c0_g1_i1.p1  ORF type:complete len:185 (+),score=53.10 TRINITY_DN12551_c0_g1_i1:292-846(+)